MMQGEFVAASAGSVFRAWKEADPQPKVLIRQDRLIFWHNQAAAELAALNAGLSITGGVLTIHVPELSADLDAALTTGAPRFSLCRPSVEPENFIIVKGLHLEQPPEENCWAVSLALAGGRVFPAPHYSGYAEAFGLTAAEARIADALARGLGAQDIAIELGLATPTVRTHVRSIYAKMSVNSQTKFYQRMLPFRIA
ncbi:helix-turn-helix transcriptional regulator [Sphingomonas panaciterrae]|uniref:helix-turn-helix transcriptional regulator n=1 Tax=Sphingomonas panaciterrae TaxID=1462999 RepID=UPI002FF257C1